MGTRTIPGRPLTEKAFQAQVLAAAKLFGWLTYHTHDSRRSGPGFPDLVLVKTGHPVLFVELKRDDGRLRPDQKKWHTALRGTGADARVWRPADWDAEIQPTLAGGAMKVLFLDVDGVLNGHEWDPAVLCGQIHRDKVARLNRVLLATGAKVVLSSAWRYILHRGEATLMGLEWLFRSHGMLADRLLGVTRTDTMVDRGPTYDGDPRSWPLTDERGQQVTDWLTVYRLGERIIQCIPGAPPHDPVTAYAVVDDLDPGITAAGHPFVRTDGAVGLTDDDADALIALLNG